MKKDANHIGDEGIKNLSFSLRNNRTLCSLNLGCNEIGINGIRYFSNTLIANANLMKIDLCIFFSEITNESG